MSYIIHLFYIHSTQKRERGMRRSAAGIRKKLDKLWTDCYVKNPVYNLNHVYMCGYNNKIITNS